MPTIIDTLITRFGFQTDISDIDKVKKNLDSFEKKAEDVSDNVGSAMGFDQLKNNILGVGAAIGALIGGGAFIATAAAGANETTKFAEALGMTTQELERMDFVARGVGVDVDTLRGQTFSLTQALNEAAETGGGIAEDLDRFGLSAKDASGNTKSLSVFVNDVRQKMQTLDATEKADLADKLFFDEETIALLTASPELVGELIKKSDEFGGLTKENAAGAKLFSQNLTSLFRSFESFRLTISAVTFRPLAKVFDVIADGFNFARKHVDVLFTFIGILGAVGLAYASMGIKAAAAWVMALGPMALIIAGIVLVSAAIAVLVEDFTAFFNGQDSFIGDMVKKWPLIGDAIFFVRDAAMSMFKGTVEGFSIWWDWLSRIGGAIIDFILNPIESIIKAIDRIPDLSGILGSIGDKLKSIPGVKAAFNLATGGAGGGGGSPIAPALGQAGGAVTKTNTFQLGDIKIDARGSDSEEISRNLSSALRTHLQNTVQDFDSVEDR